MTTWKIKTFPR